MIRPILSDLRAMMPTRTSAPINPIPSVHVLPIIVRNNIALARKPSTPPPPPTVTTLLNAISLGLQFSFYQLTLPANYTNVIDSYRVYRNIQANNFSGAFGLRTFKHDPTNQGPITVQDSTGSGKTYYYFITSVDTMGQESRPNPAQYGPVTSL